MSAGEENKSTPAARWNANRDDVPLNVAVYWRKVGKMRPCTDWRTCRGKRKRHVGDYQSHIYSELNVCVCARVCLYAWISKWHVFTSTSLLVNAKTLFFLMTNNKRHVCTNTSVQFIKSNCWFIKLQSLPAVWRTVGTGFLLFRKCVPRQVADY